MGNVKPSIRNMAATAQDFVTFASAVTGAENANIAPDLSEKLTELADRFTTAIAEAQSSRDTLSASATFNNHQGWQKANASGFIDLAKEAKSLLVDNERALSGFNDRSTGFNINARLLSSQFSGLIRAESNSVTRDGGFRWQDPLKEFSQPTGM